MPITQGPHRGRPGIEIHLDGCRVGEFTPPTAQRYGPLVDAHLRIGRRPAAVARVHRDHGGFPVEVHLPRPDAVVAADPQPARGGRRRPRATPAATGFDGPGFDGSPGPGAPAGGRRRTPWLVGVGVVGLLVAVGAGVGGGRSTAGTAASDADATAATRAASTAPSPVVTAPRTSAAQSVMVAGVPNRRAATPAPPARPAPAPGRTSARAPRPARRSAATSPPVPASRPGPAARPAPKPAATVAGSTPASSCNPNYSGCVPDDPVDVDCAGGTGNGPSYVRGPVTVVGTDVYGLDNDKDGIGCE